MARHVLAFFEKVPPILIGIEACASSHAGGGAVHSITSGLMQCSE
jgi:hypothetical protein